VQGKDVNNGEQPLSDNGLLTLEQLKKENRELKERYILILEHSLHILLSFVNFIHWALSFFFVIDYRGRKRKF